ncbi:MAG: EVE domain-containing protein [Saprospiraceae bacterium]|nr:EVE domain-containing protein [Saprospiraceae bacterium]
MQYWLFQVNPKIFQLRAALRAEHLASFVVKTHQTKIKIGDKVIVWQTGKTSGVYALATVASEVMDMEIPAQEKLYYQVVPERNRRVLLDINYNLWNNPITKDMLQQETYFEKFHAGLPNVNYQASKEHYQTILNLIAQYNVLQEPLPDYDYRQILQFPLNQILYGPPGTGKTYQTINHALAIIEHRSLEELALEDRSSLRERFDYYQQRGAIGFVSFHQAFSYEDFVEGLKPKLEEGQLSYQVEDGVFKQMVQIADVGWEDGLRYVLIMDEINRGNISSILGELITLIEPDKRAGSREALTVTLPYSKTLFSVPPNLFLIGTMNTADKSLDSLDIALRRRFVFKAVVPNPSVLEHITVIAGIDIIQLLTTINQRIDWLLNENYCIGHAYFYDVFTFDDLKELFAYRVIPLLQEFFLQDTEAVAKVIGKAFFLQKVIPKGFYADENLSNKRNHLALKAVETWQELDFIKIYDPDYQYESHSSV